MASGTNFVSSEENSKPEDSIINDKKPGNQEEEEITTSKTDNESFEVWASKHCFDLLTRQHVVAHDKAEKQLRKFLKLYRLSMHICVILASGDYCGTHFKPALKHFDTICTRIAKTANGIFQEIVAPKNFVPSGNFLRFKDLVDTWENEYKTRQKQLITPPNADGKVSCVNYDSIIWRARKESNKTVVNLGDFW